MLRGKSDGPANPSRRKFLKTALGVAAGATVAGKIAQVAYKHHRKVKTTAEMFQKDPRTALKQYEPSLTNAHIDELIRVSEKTGVSVDRVILTLRANDWGQHSVDAIGWKINATKDPAIRARYERMQDVIYEVNRSEVLQEAIRKMMNSKESKESWRLINDVVDYGHGSTRPTKK